MTNQTPPELFAERPVRSSFTQKKGPGSKKKYIFAALAVLAFGVAALLFYQSSGETDEAEVPTIEADEQIKRRPDQPGGIDVPNQDVTVFQKVEGGVDVRPPEVERLLPPPEIPQPAMQDGASVAEPSSTTEPLKAPEVVLPIQQMAQEAEKTVQLVVPPTAAAEPTPILPPIDIQKQKEKAEDTLKSIEVPSVAAKQPEPSKPVEVQKPVGETKPMIVGQLPKELFTGQPLKNYMVQLASFPSQSVAQTQAKKLQEKHAGALDGVRLQVVRADLGAKGIYYRVQGGPLTSDHAKNICALLLEQKVGCIILKQ